jgi:FixJ family two-component response regulator
VILTDQAMPGMTGLQFAAVAAALRPAIPIILASGYAELNVPADNLIRLAKPFRRADLVSALNAAFARSAT